MRRAGSSTSETHVTSGQTVDHHRAKDNAFAPEILNWPERCQDAEIVHMPAEGSFAELVAEGTEGANLEQTCQ